jgi:SAM-dependent methyltransferase
VIEAGTSPFDHAALEYDGSFSDTHLGQLLRARVWVRLDQAFGPGDRVLELGCGTGVDALHLADRGVQVTATDSSVGMLEIARRRMVVSNANDLVTIERLDMSRLTDSEARRRWPDRLDGAFASFGALNCVPDRRRLALALSMAVHSGGRAVLVVMGPFAPWEMAWHLLHGQRQRAMRRFRRGALARVPGGSQLRVWYPSPWRLGSEFQPWFRVTHVQALGIALPPSGLALAMEDRPGLLRATELIDRQVARHGVAAWLGDHYLMELVRV